MSELEVEFRFLLRESIEDPKMDLVQATTSIQLIDSIAALIRLPTVGYANDRDFYR
jgi:hypothetical protein